MEAASDLLDDVELRNMLIDSSKLFQASVSAELSTIFIVNWIGGTLHKAHSSNLPEDKKIVLKLGTGIAGNVALTGEVHNIEDAYNDPLFDKSWDIITGVTTKAILALPIRSRNGNILGVL